jgi:pyridoxamine 5'-phosphate oxidase
MPRYKSLDDILPSIWTDLTRAANDRHHDWRLAQLATVETRNQQIHPAVRTIVLRSADTDLRTLTFYTDSRSTKIAQIALSANGQLLFWSKQHSLQLRVDAKLEVIKKGPAVEAAWENMRQSPSASDYTGLVASGSILHSTRYRQGSLNSEHHLAHAMRFTWLSLDREEHQSATFDLINSTSHWLQP